MPVSELWTRLTEPSAALGTPNLPPTLRRALWRLLSERQSDIQCILATDDEGAEPQQISWDAPEVASPAAAEAAKVRLVASPSLQDAALGVYAARLSRFSLSAPQRQTLKALGEAKQRGALQSVLTNALGIEARNYSYVIKNLEERGLVTKCPTVLQRNGGNVTATNLLMLTKFAPAEMIDPKARLTDGRSCTFGGATRLEGAGPTAEAMSAWDEAGEESGEEGGAEDKEGGVGEVAGSAALAAGGGLHVVNDDDAKLRNITNFLATMPDHTLNETELKRDLGYIGTPGHRRWRRLRNILERKQCIERFKAREGEDGPVVFVVKLLRQWVGEEDTEWALSGLLDPLTTKLDVFGTQLAEITIDRQILRHLAIAGASGVTTQVLDNQLRINIKRNEPRFRELKARFGPNGLAEQHVNQGKMRLLRYTASPEVLAVLDAALEGSGAGEHAVEAPPGGYVFAVMDAIASGLNEDGSNPLLKYLEESNHQGAEQPGTGEGAPAEAPAELEREREGDIEGPKDAGDDGGNNNTSAGPLVNELGAQAMDTTTTVAPVLAPDPISARFQELTQVEEATTGNGTASDGGEEVRAFGKKRKPPPTELAALRRQWLVDRVHRDGLLLMAEMGAFLQAMERTVRNNPNAVRPDRKVNQRVIDAAVKAGQIVVLHVTFPGIHGSLSARPHTVLAKPGTQHDTEFVDRVFEAHRAMLKRIREISSAAIIQSHYQGPGEDLPVVASARNKEGRPNGGAAGQRGDGAMEKPPSGIAARDLTHKRLMENGLNPARMQRARKLHDAAWVVLSARGGAPCANLSPSISAAAETGKVFLVGHVPSNVRSGRPLDMGRYEGTPEQQALVMTTEEIWRGLSVDVFVTCLGSRSEDAALVREYRHSHKTLGECRNVGKVII